MHTIRSEARRRIADIPPSEPIPSVSDMVREALYQWAKNIPQQQANSQN
jgi:hypothetical protein